MKATLQLFVHTGIDTCFPKAATCNYTIVLIITHCHPIAQAMATRHHYSLYTHGKGEKIPPAISPSHNYCIHNSDCTCAQMQCTCISMLHHMNIYSPRHGHYDNHVHVHTQTMIYQSKYSMPMCRAL